MTLWIKLEWKGILLKCHPELWPACCGEDCADESELEEGGRDVEHDGGEHRRDAAGAAVDCLKGTRQFTGLSIRSDLLTSIWEVQSAGGQLRYFSCLLPRQDGGKF